MAISQLYPNQRPTLNLNFARSKALDPRITLTRNSTATYVGSDGLFKTAAAGEARFDHDENGNCRGLLIEESRTNKLPYSTFATGWTSQGAVIASTTELAPDGTNTAVSIYGPDTAGTKALYVSSNQNGTGVNIFSFYAKATQPGAGQRVWINYFAGSAVNTDSPLFDLDTGLQNGNQGATLGDAESYTTYHGNGWWRIHLKMTPTGNHNYKWSAGVRKGEGEILIWGAQLEEGTFETSIIPTSGSTVTRAADVCTITGDEFSSWYNQSEGTFGIDAFGYNLNDDIDIFTNNNNDQGFGGGTTCYYSDVNGTRVVKFTGPVKPTNQNYKIIGAYGAGSYGYAVDGTAATSIASTSVPTVNQLVFFRNLANGSIKSGYLQRFAYYPTRLSDSQLQELTS